MAHNPACERFWPELSPFIDGELAPSERTHLERHLAACPDCTALVADLRAGSGLMRLGMEMAADEADFTDFAQKVLARVTPDRPPFMERLRLSFDEFFTHQRNVWMTSLATAAVVMLVAVPVLLLRTAQPAGYAGELMELQAVRVAEEAHVQPVVLEAEADKATIVWLVDEPTRDDEDEDLRRQVSPKSPAAAPNLNTPRPEGGEL